MSFLLAMTLRLGWSAFEDGQILTVNLLVFSSVCAGVALMTGLSFPSWRFVSTPDVFVLTRGIMIAVVGFMSLSFLIAPLTAIPRSVPLIALSIMIIVLGGIRVLYRGLVEGNLSIGFKDSLHADLSIAEPVYLLVYGATVETDAFLRALQSEARHSYVARHSYQVVGIIDNDPSGRDRHIRGTKVIGGSAELPQIVKSFAESSITLTSLVLSTNALPRKKLCEIVDAAANAGLRAVRLPPTHDLLHKANETFAFEPIEVTALLGREPVSLRLDASEALIRGSSVVVTGGGGSIGSELCRHILKHHPAKLVIIDNSEFNLFSIERELAATDRGVMQPVLASIRDRERIQAIFEQARVDFVFHAAAYKHVPLVESNPVEGILTNVVGTSNVADAAAAVGAAAMIMVSTDKAVKPSCIMGLSKRIAETYCQATDLACAERGLRTRFLTVRFGNVLGSSGSVVPIFEQQIREGGPLTVTDPAMTRYFMTIAEAVELVIQGSIFAFDRESLGGILVLDMGDPVPVVELARRMISLAGFVPERDIAVKFIGMRDGEKLHEELFDDNEIVETTAMPGIRLARSKVKSMHHMRELRDRILQSGSSGNGQAVIAMLREALPEGSHMAFADGTVKIRGAEQAVEQRKDARHVAGKNRQVSGSDALLRMRPYYDAGRAGNHEELQKLCGKDGTAPSISQKTQPPDMQL
jgi:O-antigen biosynthesis protein WbqV